jgi:hypothetical protein
MSFEIYEPDMENHVCANAIERHERFMLALAEDDEGPIGTPGPKSIGAQIICVTRCNLRCVIVPVTAWSRPVVGRRQPTPLLLNSEG